MSHASSLGYMCLAYGVVCGTNYIKYMEAIFQDLVSSTDTIVELHFYNAIFVSLVSSHRYIYEDGRQY